MLDYIEQRTDEEVKLISEWVAENVKLQGQDQFLGVVIKNEEKRRPSGLYIPNTDQTQDIPHLCKVIQLSPHWDAGSQYRAPGIFPDVKVGCTLMFKQLSCDVFDVEGVTFVRGDAGMIRFVYNNDAISPLERGDWSDIQRQNMDADRAKAGEGEPSQPIPSRIVMK